LLVMISLGDQDEAMAGGELAERRGNVGEKFDLMLGDGLGEAFDTAMLFVRHGGVAELLEAGDQRSAEAVESVAVGEDGVVLDSIEVAANLFRSVDAVIEVGDETSDGTLEVDVVLPERVVRVNQEGLVGWATVNLGRGVHILIIKVAGTTPPGGG
jgi:hypothetical protein